MPASRLGDFDRVLADHLYREVLVPCVDLREFNIDQVERSDQENRAIVYTLKWGLLALGLGGPLGGLVLGYGVARRLHQSIYQLSVRIRDAAGRLNRDWARSPWRRTATWPTCTGRWRA